MNSRRLVWRWSMNAGAMASRRTARRRALPDFLIIGGQRCGTTSLARSLRQHPHVEGPRIAKGVHYFDTSFDRSPDWYRAHFATRSSIERRGRKLGGPVRVGEASPYYLFHPDAARRVASTIPRVRVIAVLRDPVERAWSHFHHEKARGFEDLEFSAAIRCESARLAGAEEHLISHPEAASFEHQHHSYLARGRYSGQLSRYFERLGRERVLVLFSDELFAEPERQLEVVQRFLEVPVKPVALRRDNPSDAPPVPAHVAEDLRRSFTDADASLITLLDRPLPWRTVDPLA